MSQAGRDALRRFLEGGDWSEDALQVEAETALEILRERPGYLLRSLWDEERHRGLLRVFGSVRWADALRQSVEQRLDSEASLLPQHWRSIVRLATESLLMSRFRQIASARRPDHARTWIRSLDADAEPSTELPIDSVAPQALLGLTLDPQWMNEKDQRVREMLRRAILVDSAPDPSAPWRKSELMAIAAIRAWTVRRASDDADEASRWATRLGVAEEDLAGDLSAVVRGVDSRSLADCASDPWFEESIKFFDLETMMAELEELEVIDETARESRDTWVAAFAELAKGSGRDSSEAMSRWRELAGEAASRRWALQQIEGGIALSPEGFDRCIQQERPSGGLWAEVCVGLLKAKLTGQAGVADEVDAAGLGRWWHGCIQRLREGALDHVEPPVLQELLACRPEELSSLDERVIEEIRRCCDQNRIDSARAEARAQGRDWVIELVEWSLGRASSHGSWMHESWLMTPEDVQVIDGLIEASRQGERQWWAVRLPLSQQVRIRSFALRECGIASAGGDSLRRMVEEQRGEFFRACADSDSAHTRRLSDALDVVCAHVVDEDCGESSPDPRLLESFLLGEIPRFRRMFRPPQLELPVRRIEVRLWRPASVMLVAIGVSMMAIVGPGVFARIDRIVAPESPELIAVAPAPAETPEVVDLRQFAVDWAVAGVEWQSLPDSGPGAAGGRRWGRLIRGDELERHLSRALIGSGSDQQDVPAVEYEVAREFVARFLRDQRARHPAGLLDRGRVTPWTELEIGLPDEASDAALALQMPGVDRVWAANGEILRSKSTNSEPRADRLASIYVIIED